MTLKDFDFELPEELIAQHPIKEREKSRMMTVNRKTGKRSEKVFEDIVDLLETGDTLVLNDSKVIPARLFGRLETGGKMEVLLLEEVSPDTWEVLMNPGRKGRVGRKIVFSDRMEAEVIEIKDTGNRVLKFTYEGIWEEELDQLGEMPLPPYIHETLEEQDRYQTVYAKYQGSAAAPTAGLHFTDDVLQRLKDKGVNLAFVTLHVGLGTFRPVKGSIEEHVMHEEAYEISQETADLLNQTKKNGGKIVAVGTTSCRTLEAAVEEDDSFKPCSGRTDIFIKPGYKFKAIDELITNFHLPESTLLMLISAFSTREIVLEAYEEAIENKYRFFSFGDAMYFHQREL